MNNPKEDPVVRAIRHAADAWVVRLQGEPDEAARTAFADWLCASPVHVAEYLRAEAAWLVLAECAATRTDDVEHLSESGGSENSRVIDFLAEMDRRSLDMAPREGDWRRERRPRRRRGAWSVALLAACAAIALAWLPQPLPGTAYATAIGEIRRIPLEDGSILELNTGSEVKVRFQRHRRDILLQRGEAFVSVAPDPDRPLRILAEGVGVRAVGTAFNVRRQDAGLHVTVTAGRVAVQPEAAAATRWQQLLDRVRAAPAGAGPQAAIPVKAGQQLELSLGEGRILAASTRPLEAARWLGWRSRQLEFNRERLDAVVAELNRYSRHPIILQDHALAERRISGGFDPTEPETLLRFLQMHGDVQVADGPHGELLVSLVPPGSNR